jgi:hypothetical protein
VATFVEKLQSFRTFVQKQIAEHKIRNDNIINMDEVPLTFDIPMKPIQRLSCAVELCSTLDRQPSAQERILQVGPLVPASVVRVPGMPFWISLSYEGSLSAKGGF